MNLSNTFNADQTKLLNQAGILIQNKDYSKEELSILFNKTIEYVMNNSLKNKDMSNSLREYNDIINILDNYSNWKEVFTQMTLEMLNDIIESKINQNENFIIFTFYELMVKHDVHKDESGAVIDLIKQKLINYNYDVYITGESYIFNSVTYTVPINISLIAIKNPYFK